MATQDVPNPTPGEITIDKKTFSLWKVLLPVVIGLGVVVYMFLSDAKKENLVQVLSDIDFTPRTWFCIALAFLFMFGRDFGLSWRFRALTDKDLSWGRAFKVDFLCEFTSCVTPSAVGGSSLGMVFLNTQGIEFGRATTLMMTTLFLDELFFVVSCPLVVMLTPAHEIFASDGTTFSHGIQLTFWLVYAVLFVWTLILFTGIIWRPQCRLATICLPRRRSCARRGSDFGWKCSEAQHCHGSHVILWSTHCSLVSFPRLIIGNG